MAWLTGSFVDTAVGRMIPMLDTELVKNGNWTVDDNAAWLAPASLVVNGDFALGAASWTVGAGWSCATLKAVHTPAGGTATLSQALVIRNGYYYTVTFTVALAAGTVTCTHTGLSGTLGAIAAPGTYSYVGLSSADGTTLTFTPVTGFDGSIDDVSVIQYCQAANCKVYRCTGTPAVCDFYLKVEDEHIGHSIIELWQGWNNGTHTGTGLSKKSTTSSAEMTIRISRPAGFYNMSLHDNYFTLITSGYNGYFIGRPTLYDVSKNIVMLIAELKTTTNLNSLAMYDNVNYNLWAFLFDEAGNQTQGRDAGGGTISNAAYRWLKGIDGKYHITEVPIGNITTTLLVGTLPGVASGGDAASGLAQGDIVTISGVDWLAIKGAGTAYYALVRKD